MAPLSASSQWYESATGLGETRSQGSAPWFSTSRLSVTVLPGASTGGNRPSRPPDGVTIARYQSPSRQKRKRAPSAEPEASATSTSTVASKAGASVRVSGRRP
jgi:hypothetical protein